MTTAEASASRPRLHRWLLLPLTAALIAGAACGGGPSSQPDGPAARPAAAEQIAALINADGAAPPAEDPYDPAPLSATIPDDAPGRQLRWLLEAVARLPRPRAEIEEHFAPSVLSVLSPDQVNQALGVALDPSTTRFLGVHSSTPTSIEAALVAGGGRARQVLDLVVDADGRIAGLQPGFYPLRSRAERGLDPVSIPVPSGPHAVGTTTIVVTDGGREGRRIPVQLWYPAMPGTGDASAPYAPPATAALLADQVAVPDEDVSGIETHGRGDASPELSAGALPVVLVSPGYEVTRSSYSGYGAELASHGYLVAVLDHPGDGKLVEYPDGSTVPGEGSADFESLVAAHASDARAVLDELRRLDGPLSGALDLDRVAFVGHSLGGATAAETMRLDPRVDVGVNLDGSMLGPVLETGLERPFLLMGGAGEEDETWRTFFSRSPAGEWLVIDGAAHMAFSDVPVLAGLRLAEELTDDLFGIGTIDPPRSAEVQRTYLVAFLDRHLRGTPTTLFDGPSDAHPEVELR